MEKETLNGELRGEALGLGMCGMWQQLWSGEKDHYGLLELYKRGIDWCIKRDWPRQDYMDSHFPKEMQHYCHIFAGEEVGAEMQEAAPWGLPLPWRGGTYTLRGCTGELSFRLNDTATVHLWGGSRVRVKACGMAKIIVFTYDDAVCEAEERDMGSVRVKHISQNG